MKKTTITTGKRTKIFTRSLSSIPMNYKFQASALDNQPLKGEVEVTSRTLFSKNPVKKFQLQENNVVNISRWDTFLDIYVTSEYDIELMTSGKGFSSKNWIIIFALLVFAGIVSGLIGLLAT